LRRRILSWSYFIFEKALFRLPLSDTQTGLQAYRRCVLERVFQMMKVSGFAFNMELVVLSLRLGYRLKSVPIVLKYERPKRGFPASKMLRMAWDTLKVFYHLHTGGYSGL